MSEVLAYSRNLSMSVDELLPVSSTLRMDIESLLDAYHDDRSNQALRRVLIRSSWSMIEGTVFCAKQLTLRACELGSINLPAGEHVFLSELRFIVDQAGNAKVNSVREDTLSNLKRALKIVALRFDVAWKPDFGGKGWQALTSSLDIRHRLTHPKSSSELEVSDHELSLHQAGFGWFVQSFNGFQLALLAKYGKA